MFDLCDTEHLEAEKGHWNQNFTCFWEAEARVKTLKTLLQ